MIDALHGETNSPAPAEHRARIECTSGTFESVALTHDDAMDAELRTLKAQLDELLLAAPGMASWVERVAHWEIDHRDPALQPH